MLKERSKKWYDEDKPKKIAKDLLENLGLKPSNESVETGFESFRFYMGMYNTNHFHNEEHGVCTLCGNGGVVNTKKTAISPKGHKVGEENWCFCPNGDAARYGNYIDGE